LDSIIYFKGFAGYIAKLDLTDTKKMCTIL